MKEKNILNFKLPKIKNPKIERVRITKSGERTSTASLKRKLKEKAGYRCEVCKKKFPDWQLQIHHKKEISKHKSPYGVDVPVLTIGKKHKPKYDEIKNLQVICIPCHNKTKKRKKKKPKPIWERF